MADWNWDLTRLDPGELSKLRRSAGLDVEKADMAALRAFYRACGYCRQWQEKYLFPAVCMDALWRIEDQPTVKPMEECLRDLSAEEQDTTESLKHRIDILLETPWDRGGFLTGKLLNLIKILKSKTNLKPDFQKLSEDLSKWDDPRRTVQRAWLRTIYNVKPEMNKQEEEQTNVD